jgi:hypothetical protein
MEYVGEPPWMDLDNLAKALLDAIKGYAFHDDAQVARLLVERRPGERERIIIQVRKLRLKPYAAHARRLRRPRPRRHRQEGAVAADAGRIAVGITSA